MQTGIYAIENIRTGQVYVGATKLGFEQRWYTHRNYLNHGTHPTKLLQDDWQTYGQECFRFIVLEILPPEATMADREQAWIDAYAASPGGCYNRVRATERYLRPHPIENSIQPVTLEEMFGHIYTPEEIAALLSVSVGVINTCIFLGWLKGVQYGSVWRIQQGQLDAFVQRILSTRQSMACEPQ